MNQLPAKLDPLRRDLAKLQGMLDGERAKLAETDTWRKAQQELIDRERDALKIAQNKLQASKNSKEFGAASREVENKRKSISDRETELKKVSEASGAQTAQLEARDKDVEVLRDELAASEAAHGRPGRGARTRSSPRRRRRATRPARRSTSSGSRSTTRCRRSAATRSRPS